MPNPKRRTKPCDPVVRAGRLAKANEFVAAADIVATIEEAPGQFNDAVITLYIHAGIAASDVICCARLGEHPQGESHTEAVGLLARADRESSRKLEVLLGMKTRSGYGSTPSSADQRRRAQRAANALVRAASNV